MPRVGRDPRLDWCCMDSVCITCREGDFTSEYGPRCFVECSSCKLFGTHVECYAQATGKTLSQQFLDSGSDFFCSKECEDIYSELHSMAGKRIPIRGEETFSLEMVRYCKEDRTIRSTVQSAIKVFKGSFAPLIMSNGMDLIEMVCQSYETPPKDSDEDEASDEDEDKDEEEEEEEIFDFSNFRLLVLRQGATIVTVATIRFWGIKFAEMPFVATKDGFRRAGNCKRLMRVVEEMLTRLKVRYLVLPSMRQLLPMWTGKFKFQALTLLENQQLDDHIVCPDTASVQLVKKAMHVCPLERAAAERADRAERAARLQQAAADVELRVAAEAKASVEAAEAATAAAAAAAAAAPKPPKPQRSRKRSTAPSSGEGTQPAPKRRRGSALQAGALAAPVKPKRVVTPEQRAKFRRAARAKRRAEKDMMLGICLADAVQAFLSNQQLQHQHAESCLQAELQSLRAGGAALQQQLQAAQAEAEAARQQAQVLEQQLLQRTAEVAEAKAAAARAASSEPQIKVVLNIINTSSSMGSVAGSDAAQQDLVAEPLALDDDWMMDDNDDCCSGGDAAHAAQRQASWQVQELHKELPAGCQQMQQVGSTCKGRNASKASGIEGAEMHSVLCLAQLPKMPSAAAETSLQAASLLAVSSHQLAGSPAAAQALARAVVWAAERAPKLQQAMLGPLWSPAAASAAPAAPAAAGDDVACKPVGSVNSVAAASQGLFLQQARSHSTMAKEPMAAAASGPSTASTVVGRLPRSSPASPQRKRPNSPSGIEPHTLEASPAAAANLAAAVTAITRHHDRVPPGLPDGRLRSRSASPEPRPASSPPSAAAASDSSSGSRSRSVSPSPAGSPRSPSMAVRLGPGILKLGGRAGSSGATTPAHSDAAAATASATTAALGSGASRPVAGPGGRQARAQRQSPAAAVVPAGVGILQYLVAEGVASATAAGNAAGTASGDLAALLPERLQHISRNRPSDGSTGAASKSATPTSPSTQSQEWVVAQLLPQVVGMLLAESQGSDSPASQGSQEAPAAPASGLPQGVMQPAASAAQQAAALAAVPSSPLLAKSAAARSAGSASHSAHTPPNGALLQQLAPPAASGQADGSTPILFAGQQLWTVGMQGRIAPTALTFSSPDSASPVGRQQQLAAHALIQASRDSAAGLQQRHKPLPMISPVQMPRLGASRGRQAQVWASEAAAAEQAAATGGRGQLEAADARGAASAGSPRNWNGASSPAIAASKAAGAPTATTALLPQGGGGSNQARPALPLDRPVAVKAAAAATGATGKRRWSAVLECFGDDPLLFGITSPSASAGPVLEGQEVVSDSPAAAAAAAKQPTSAVGGAAAGIAVPGPSMPAAQPCTTPSTDLELEDDLLLQFEEVRKDMQLDMLQEPGGEPRQSQLAAAAAAAMAMAGKFVFPDDDDIDSLLP